MNKTSEIQKRVWNLVFDVKREDRPKAFQAWIDCERPFGLDGAQQCAHDYLVLVEGCKADLGNFGPCSDRAITFFAGYAAANK